MDFRMNRMNRILGILKVKYKITFLSHKSCSSLTLYNAYIDLSFPRRRESSPEKALVERQIGQYFFTILCHPYGILKCWIPASAGTTVL